MVSERVRFITSPFRLLPHFIIPGETKCGTTSFFRSLYRHPLIKPSYIKEPNNFIRYGGTSLFCRMHYPLIFNKIILRKLLVGEASVEYFSKPEVPKAIFSLIPDVKLIIMLRNPVSRAISDFKMMKEAGVELGEFDTVISQAISWLQDKSLEKLVSTAIKLDAPPLRYVTKGCYWNSLKAWFDVFPREQFLFIKSENFFTNPQSELNRTYKFLGLDTYEIDDVLHLRKAKREIKCSHQTIEKMVEYFKECNHFLSKEIGGDFIWEEEPSHILSKL